MRDREKESLPSTPQSKAKRERERERVSRHPGTVVLTISRDSAMGSKLANGFIGEYFADN